MKIFRWLKKQAYFFVAYYFAYCASFALKRWKPTVIVVTGSSGKTTLLHLLEAQLKGKALFSHKANSAFGIPFNILGLERSTYRLSEWFMLVMSAPFKIFRSLPAERIYVAEADADRPGEGRLLAWLLRPDVVIWLSLEEAHGINYDSLMQPDAASSPRDKIREIIAREFGYFLEAAQHLAVLDKDNPYIATESKRSKASVVWVGAKDISSFVLEQAGVSIVTSSGVFHLPELVPADVGLSVVSTAKVVEYLKEPLDPTFSKFYLPPGRSSVFKGQKGITIIDSTYNATFDGMRAMLDFFSRYSDALLNDQERWLVLGDMIEQGKSELEEHRLLADMVIKADPKRVILVGPRLTTITYPILLKKYGRERVVSYMMPGEALSYLEKELKGGELVLFKGARYLEGAVEKLLHDPGDAAKLCRREDIWIRRRKQWGV